MKTLDSPFRRFHLRGSSALVAAWLCCVVMVSGVRGQSTDRQIFGPAVDPATRAVDVRNLFTLRRVVRHFAFEESRERPLDLPLGFFRYIEPDLGFPAFGSMGPTSAVAYEGEYSFGFELDGGSMAARVPTSIVPILPKTDYIVSAMVRTEDLTTSSATIVAWFYDVDGNEIPGSRVESAPINTQGQWERVNIRLLGRFDAAVDLGLELNVVQANQRGVKDPGQARPLAPVLEDVDGGVWFDDLIVVHAPSHSMTTPGGSRLLEHDEPLELIVRVHDTTGEDIQGSLTITDFEGNIVGFRDVSVRDGHHPRRIVFDDLDADGWYQAVLRLEQDGITIAQRTIALTRLSERRPVPELRRTRFGIRVADDLTLTDPSMVPMALKLGVVHANVPIWSPGFDLDALQERFPIYLKQLEQLLSGDIGLTFRLDALPDDLCAEFGLDRTQIHNIFAESLDAWRPYLDPMLINFGLEVRHWEVGPSIDVETALSASILDDVLRTGRAFGQFIPTPVVMSDWPLSIEHDDGSPLPGYRISLPPSVRGEAIGLTLEPWMDRSFDLHVHLESLDGQVATPRQRVIDLSVRTFHAWRSGVRSLSIDAPWSVTQSETGEHSASPDVLYPVWRTLNDQLADRRYVGELDLGPGVHCWILQGESTRDGCLLLWSDGALRTEVPALSHVLGARSARVIELSGDRHRVNLADGLHTIAARSMPVFIDEIDIPLAMFRASFALDPGDFEAEHRKHEHSLVLTNPWDVAISGVVDLRESPNWTIRPRSSRFNIAPGETQYLPIEIVFDRSVPAGPKTLMAETTLRAEDEYEILLSTRFEISHPDLEMIGQWRVEPNPDTGADDLVIVQYTMNRGTTPVNLQSTFSAPGISQQRSSLGQLDPGATAIKSYRVADGVAALSGRDIRLGVLERDGPKRMHRILSIPDFYGTRGSGGGTATANASDSDGE